METSRAAIRAERNKAKDAIRTVVTLVVALAAVVIILPMLTSNPPEYYRAQDLYNAAIRLKKNGDLDTAISKLKQIPDNVPEIYRKGEKLLDEIQREKQELQAAMRGEDEKAFEKFKTYVYGHPRDTDNITVMVEDFRKKFPYSRYIENIDTTISDAQKRMELEEEATFKRMLDAVDNALLSNEYEQAMSILIRYYDSHKYSKKRDNIIKKQKDIVDSCMKYYSLQSAKANRLIGDRKYQEARSIYSDILNKIGGTPFAEFKNIFYAANMEIDRIAKLIQSKNG
ncbi:MAG: hypothetical protein A2W05_11585 [Candidatus Schekmanbacteria bacterium RBG_16_38_10]|uniref:Uncharacterized protein n=1 Tax=Candidatus Schekmanbacteria bacterium RBG_16_38_10 TaxID=1817879 RepID=A0A1F7RW85_9BACT|nr:MAG: hypothetical protein A2W05_11585 [Candidatus Schekmanbacteria bacterium RBG_16_38_10]